MTPVPLLPQELLLLQLQALELVESLFPLPGEVLISSASCATRRWIEAGGAAVDKHGRDRLRAEGNWEDELRLTVIVRLLEDEDEGERTFTLALSVSIPLCQVDDGRPTTPDGAPYAFLSLQQPPWLSRAAHDSLSAFLPSSQPDSNLAEYGSNAELVLQTIEVVKEEGAKLVPKKEEEVVVEEEEVPEFRVWCWFMSISTREKRNDIVNWAPGFNLTGFLLSGKPGIMCLEGTEANVQAFLSDIKSRSWADIPSFQKKVSERYRSPLLARSVPVSPSEDPTARRLFTSMDEITNLIPRSGFRGHGSEMGVVKAYLEERGLGEAFGLVVGGGQFA